MKNLLAMLFATIVMTGCAGQQHATSYPCAETLPKKDKSEEIKVFVYEGTSWIWNESTQAWDWFTSGENKARAGKVWETTKQVASDTYDKAMKAYNERDKN